MPPNLSMSTGFGLFRNSNLLTAHEHVASHANVLTRLMNMLRIVILILICIYFCCAFASRLLAASLSSVVRRAKREIRKWPRAWVMARDGRGRSRARALLSLNLKKKRDCSQSTLLETVTRNLNLVMRNAKARVSGSYRLRFHTWMIFFSFSFYSCIYLRSKI